MLATVRNPSAVDLELCYAARQRDMNGCRRAIKKGADVNAKEEGDAPLHWAAFWGDRAVAQILLASGADRSMPNKHGRIAAVDAQKMGHTDVVRLLFEWGPDAVEATRVAAVEIKELEDAKDTAGLEEWIQEHRRTFILGFQCDESETSLSRLAKEENAAKQELASAVHASDIDGIEGSACVAAGYKSLQNKASAAVALCSELVEAENTLISSFRKTIQDARQRGLEKLQAAIEALRRKGTRLAAEVAAGEQAVKDLTSEWENAEQELKEGLASVKAAEKEDQEGLVTALKETIEKYQKMKPIQEMVAAIQASLTEFVEGQSGGKKKK